MVRLATSGGQHICGFYYCLPPTSQWQTPPRKYLPQVKLEAHATIFSSIARTTLRQTFVNPDREKPIPELRYTFPLYDGVSVVGFTCTVGGRVIKGVVKEREQARKTYQDAVNKGETAALLEQLPKASDVFTTTVGNIPAGAEIHVELTYLGELKHDAEVDGVRYTIPTSIAPRYGSYPGEIASADTAPSSGINITVDAQMPTGSAIKKMQSPSHNITLHVGVTSSEPDADMCLEKGHLTLIEGTAELEKDFVVQIVAQNVGDPVAVVEDHPTIPNHRALMATLVPKFSLPPSKPEIVFVCDRSGSMSADNRIPRVKSALNIFLKSLPVGVKFNICSFGSRHSFLWDRSQSYSQQTLEEATKHVDTFGANFGGTEMLQPVSETFKRRYKDMDLEVFILTDGEIWGQNSLFDLIRDELKLSKGATRVFTLGIGKDVSHALVEGAARAGGGFSQIVTGKEKMDAKIVRMLKASLTPHVTDYTLEVRYNKDGTGMTTTRKDESTGDDFELIEKVQDALVIDAKDSRTSSPVSKAASGMVKKAISLFDKSINLDASPAENKNIKNKYDHLPKVDEPKILQAPFEIPALFPFSRTSVYLLLSPDAPSQSIKSVKLRGSCQHGPLELDIPVTTLAEKGETIHQLAAKKAVQDLEEGRGWLTGAKDKSGKLLKIKYDGRFSDMVEREAVRLGVKFQVGGKWCSFVAVETKDGEDEVMQDDAATLVETEPEPELQAPQPAGGTRYRRTGQASHGLSFRAAMPQALMARGGGGIASFPAKLLGEAAAPSKSPKVERPSTSLKPMDSCIEYSAAPSSPPAAPAAQAFGGKSARFPPLSQSSCGYVGPTTRPLAARAPSQRWQQVSSANIAPARSTTAISPPPRRQLASKAAHSPRDLGSISLEAEVDNEDAESGEDYNAMCLGPDDDSNHISTVKQKKGSGTLLGSPATTPTPAEAMSTLVRLQTFEGYWKCEDVKLWAVLGINAMEVEAVLPKEKNIDDDVVATTAAIAFFKSKLADEKDIWEMIVEKAEAWVRNKTGTDPDGLVAKVVGLF
ncbi:von Willebrand factor type A domain-containing protein [Zalerion maritima]|uniref:von Willebrand factor type A domain-containing protein n=1 Tax=Zalerion maritima TaxID=339359 RepID=A0AAD5WQY6_9PEZI|nr:von Willebrand factor type A domain-containing protein [Zalerion maritima]